MHGGYTSRSTNLTTSFEMNGTIDGWAPEPMRTKSTLLYIPVALTTTTSTFWWLIMGLHGKPLSASISYDYIKQGQSNSMTIPTNNDATSVSSTSPISGYILNHL